VVKKLLFSGRELDNLELAKLINEAQRSIVEYKLAEYASRGTYSKKELQRKVNNYSKKKFDFVLEQQAMEKAFAKLESELLYDSKSIVTSWINLYISRAKSKNYIRSKLISKGFEKNEIDETLNSSNTQKFDENLKSQLEKKIKILRPKAKNEYDLKQKLIKFALGKGFGYKEVKEILGEMI
jgi:regulatory protein